MDFAALNLTDDVLRALTEMGFEEPSPIQREAIPVLLQGADLIAQALTGTGKTAAFGIPIAERLDPGRQNPGAIILVPTRELAVQVAAEVHRIGKFRQLQVLPVYGGQPYERQLRALSRGVDIIVATPGRLMDHMRQGKVDLSHISMLILDEADEMLDMGFIEDIEFVMGHLPTDRQTAVFSATMPGPIVALCHRYMRDPATITLGKARGLTVPSIQQSYYVVPFPRKFDTLCRLIDLKQPSRSIVFAATKRTVDEVAERLQGCGYAAEPLHGDLTQAQRERVMRAFREGRTDILVATDVAARGVDVENVTHVFNFDIPLDPEYYVHRVGRTGRAGRAGEAVTLVNPREQQELRAIQVTTGASIRRAEVPSSAEVEEHEREVVAERVERYLQEGRWGPYRGVVQELSVEHDPIDIASAALALLGQRQRRAQRQPERAQAAPAVGEEKRATGRRERRKPATKPRPRPAGAPRRRSAQRPSRMPLAP